ncbi:helix-turn-helix domain-containing protein [Actinokineospora xionganensis]|uniref:helix-turn-helix domain-containing protein n=1 Tax=Actinokineospora xionganensis TaxID=2684470 RepID=UPI0028A6E421|nr:helix-turn-helix domain-containing protein [Actinokineospora xionganensis]
MVARLIGMSRFRLQPTPAQERVLLEHCGHARFVWNLAVEQHARWKPGRKAAPGFVEQCRQLTRARAENPWLAAGSATAQQQALKDFSQAMETSSAGPTGCPPGVGLGEARANAALNIRFAAGHAVTGRGGAPLGEPANREPQRDLFVSKSLLKSQLSGGEDVNVNIHTSSPTR